MHSGAAVPVGVELQPLRWPGDIEPGESLLGFVTRRAAEHFLGSNRIVLASCGIDLRHQGTALFECQPEHIAKLARILRVDERELSALACDLVGEDHGGTLIRWGSRTMRQRDIEARFRRISPVSLAATEYHRQSWLVRLLPYCPESFAELIQECPVCGRPLRWSQAKPIAMCDSRECAYGETPIPQSGTFLPERMREPYSRFVELISHDPDVSEKAYLSLHSDLRELDNPSLIDLVFLMGSIDRPMDKDARKFTWRGEGAIEIAARTVAGVEAVGSWPEKLLEVTTRAIDNRKSEPHLWSRLKRVAKNCPNPVVRNLLVSTVPALLDSLKCANAPNRAPIMLQTELVRRTHLRSRRAAVLSQHLRNKTKAGNAGSTKLDLALAEEFIHQRKNSKDNGAISYSLHLPSYAIDQLCASGRLVGASNAGVVAVHPEGRTMTASFEMFMEDLVEASRGPAGEEEMLSLSAAASVIGGGGKPWAEIMEAILTGELQCCRREECEKPTTRSLMVRRRDLPILERLRAETVFEDRLPSLLSKTDTKELLNITNRQCVKLEEAGLLSFGRHHRKLACRTKSGLAIARERICGAEASLLTGVRSQGLDRAVNESGVEVMTGGGWCRAGMSRFIASIR